MYISHVTHSTVRYEWSRPAVDVQARAEWLPPPGDARKQALEQMYQELVGEYRTLSQRLA